MAPSRLRCASAQCASLLLMYATASSRAEPPSTVSAVSIAALEASTAAEASAALVPAATLPTTSYWYRIPRRAAAFVQTVYTVSTDRLLSWQTSTALDRLRDCEAPHGVSLMTLWEFRRSTISFQAGRNGEPTLRWSSRSMHRDEATRGLFDLLLQRTPDQPAPVVSPVQLAHR